MQNQERTHSTSLLVATHNVGKVAEYAQLLADLPLQLTSLDAEGVTEDVEETGSTFAENARLKALAYAKMTGMWAWADDSGLEVDALNGQPGVYSARYAGPQATDAENNQKLIAALRNVPEDERSARFRCVVAIATPDGQVHTVADSVEGRMVDEPRGTHGFGYDPHFYLPELDLTMAQLTPVEKNRISHRGKASRQGRELLLTLLSQLPDDAG